MDPEITVYYEKLAAVNAPYKAELMQAFAQTLDGGWYILGDQLRQFELEFAAFCGVPHCIGVANGMDALVLALQALAMPPGAEIIVPSNTYIATILAIIRAGFRPVLAEPDENTYTLSAHKIGPHIGPATKAILVVHLYGRCCPMDDILELAYRHKLYLVEDAAQAHGAVYRGRRAGSFGDAAAFSFYPTKNLGALGDGGAVCCNSGELALQLRKLRNYGSIQKHHHQELGTNSRLDELQAAFLRIKLKHLEKANRHKQCLASIYFDRLKGLVKLPPQHADHSDVHHIFPIRHVQRNRLRAFLLERGIQTEMHYPVAPVDQPVLHFLQHLYPSPVARKLAGEMLSLPLSFSHTADDVAQVALAIEEFIRNNS
jgi:dTDP-4-amino-4,6-dideoxygalactose transaminase